MAAAKLLNRNLSRKGASSARHRVLSKSKISGASLCSAKFLFVGCLGENLHHWPSVPSECGRVTYTWCMPLCAVNMIDVTPGRVQKLWGSGRFVHIAWTAVLLCAVWPLIIILPVCLLYYLPPLPAFLYYALFNWTLEIPKKTGVLPSCYINTHEQKGGTGERIQIHACNACNAVLKQHQWRTP